MSSSDLAISVRGLSKRYMIDRARTRTTTFAESVLEGLRSGFRAPPREEFWALRDATFDVRQGEVLGVIGRNGAGKSTLLKIMSRITEPSAGEVRMTGRVGSLLEVGTGFHPELTGRENIFLNGAIIGMKRAEIQRHFDEIVAFAEVEKFLETPVKRYSSGMYTRLAFAVAAHLEPEILIIDEVLAVGDAQFQKKCLGKMKDVAGQGRTVLFVSHNMSAVVTLCHTAILLNQGKIVASGTAQGVSEEYVRMQNSTAEAVADLATRSDERYGEQRYARLEEIRIVDEEGTPTSVLPMGAKASFLLTLDVRTPSEDLEIGIAVTNMQDIAIHYFVSGWEGFNAIGSTGRHVIRVDLPHVHMFPGDYKVNVWIALRGEYYDDAVHSAMRFGVQEGRVNRHATYFTRFSKNTQVYAPSTWSCTKLGSVDAPRVEVASGATGDAAR